MSDSTDALRQAITGIIQRVGVDTRTPARAPDTDAWDALRDSAFTAVGVPADAGGAGGSLADALGVVAAAAEQGALLPVVEHTVLAAWLAATTGYDLGSATATTAVADHRCRLRTDSGRAVLDGVIADVVFADVAGILVVLIDPDADPDAEAQSSTVVVVSLRDARVTAEAGTDLVGVCVADLTFDACPVLHVAPSTVDVHELTGRGALAYAVASAGAARAVRDRTVQHASDREQFGRPLSRFQAVQQHLARLAALVAMTDTAASCAVEVVESAGMTPASAEMAVAAAKVVSSSSAREIAAIGHQIHGAMGFTAEHTLGRFTTELWAWRDRYGSERYWADVLASHILDDGFDVWDVVVAGGIGSPGADGASR